MWIFYEKFDDEGNNAVDSPNIYNVEGDNRLSPSPTTRSVLIFFFFSNFVNVFSLRYIILLSSAKQNIQVLSILV